MRKKDSKKDVPEVKTKQNLKKEKEKKIKITKGIINEKYYLLFNGKQNKKFRQKNLSLSLTLIRKLIPLFQGIDVERL